LAPGGRAIHLLSSWRPERNLIRFITEKRRAAIGAESVESAEQAWICDLNGLCVECRA
jgi:hypothetical protein